MLRNLPFFKFLSYVKVSARYGPRRVSAILALAIFYEELAQKFHFCGIKPSWFYPKPRGFVTASPFGREKSVQKSENWKSQKITVFPLYLRHLSTDPQLLRGKKMLPGMPDHIAFYAQGNNLMPGAQKWPPKSITPQKKQPLFLAPVNFGRRFGAFMPRFGQRHYNRLCSARPGVHPDTRNISNWYNQ